MVVDVNRIHLAAPFLGVHIPLLVLPCPLLISLLLEVYCFSYPTFACRETRLFQMAECTHKVAPSMLVCCLNFATLYEMRASVLLLRNRTHARAAHFMRRAADRVRICSGTCFRLFRDGLVRSVLSVRHFSCTRVLDAHISCRSKSVVQESEAGLRTTAATVPAPRPILCGDASGGGIVDSGADGVGRHEGSRGRPVSIDRGSADALSRVAKDKDGEIQALREALRSAEEVL